MELSDLISMMTGQIVIFTELSAVIGWLRGEIIANDTR
jgi:hypothetical protein